MAAVRLWPTQQIRLCKFVGRSFKTDLYSNNVAHRFVKILVIEIFSSVLGLFGLIIGLLMSGKALDFK